MEYRAVLFDVDGTLIDTSEGIVAAVRQVIADEGLTPLDDATLLSFIGPPVQDSFQRVYGCGDAERKRLGGCFRKLYMSDDYLLRAKPYGGIFELFDNLRKSGIGIGIATYKREDYASRLLDYLGFEVYKPTLVGSDMAGLLTKSDIIEKCMKELDIRRPSEALMVGDTMHDALGAAKLAVPFLAVSYGFGFHRGDALEGVPCVGMADTPGAIAKFIGGCRVAWR